MDEKHECEECKLFNLRYVTYKPIRLKVLVDNINLIMELDSGSGSSVISEDLYLDKFSRFKL